MMKNPISRLAVGFVAIVATFATAVVPASADGSSRGPDESPPSRQDNPATADQGQEDVAPLAGENRTLVFGEDDNGFEGDAIAATLNGLGYRTDRSGRLPSDISAYSVIWYVEAYRGLTASEIASLQAFVTDGGSLYVTGERPCCEELNDSVEQVINAVLEDGRRVGVGGQGDLSGTFSFNPAARGGIVTQPNLLADFIPVAPGALTGWGTETRAPEVFAGSETNVVGAVWTENELRGPGRLVILMDIDWIGEPGADEVTQNIQAFLSRETCSNASHRVGFTWLGGDNFTSPANCSTILDGAKVSWTALVDGGGGAFEVNAVGALAECESPQVGTFPSIACTITLPDGVAEGSIRVTGSDPFGSTTRFYRVTQRNDPRNIPPGFSNQDDWWEFPDRDADGIPDKWETDGVWVDGDWLDLPGAGANPDHKDLFIHWDYQAGEALDNEVLERIEKVFENAPLPNPSGVSGVNVHLREGLEIPDNVAPTGDARRSRDGWLQAANYSGFAGSGWAGAADVPQLAKYFYIQDDLGCYRDRGVERCPTGRVDAIRGNFATVGIDDDWCRDNRFCDFVVSGPSLNFTRATTFVHEVGHLLGLRHHGAEDEPNPDRNYKSVMTYAYSSFGIPTGPFSDPIIDYSRTPEINEDWRLGPQFGQLTFVLGQWGEDPDFYAVGGNNELRFGTGPVPTEDSGDAVLAAAHPDSIAATGDLAGVGVPLALLDPCAHGADAPFVDVDVASFASADINCIYRLGVTTGTSPTTYSPDDFVTREQMAAFLARLFEAIGWRGACPSEATPFDDVSAESFAAASIECIYSVGITAGTSPSTYSPKAFVTREQMAAFLARLYRVGHGVDASVVPTPFADLAPSSFAFNDVGRIFGLGVTTGTSPSTYSPTDFVTREQMAAFLARLYRSLTS